MAPTMTARPGDIPNGRRRALLRTGAACATALGLPLTRATAVRTVRVLSTTDLALVQPLVDQFEASHRAFAVDYVELGSTELMQAFLADGGRGADVLWSSAMDLQIKLVNDGHAARHVSPHAASLPRWAVWKHEAYATTYEPVGLVHHRDGLTEGEVPRTHAALAALLRAEPARFRRRVATYDIERSGLGYLLAAHDAQVTQGAWDLVQALAASQARLYVNTQDMLDSVRSGQTLLAYNVLGTYAAAAAASHPELVLVYPGDYTLIASRVAFVTQRAPNAEGARQWMDHLLSAAGQRVLADECRLYPVRTDLDGARTGSQLQRQLGAAARPIPLGPGLMAPLDQSRRAAFLKRWQHAFAAAR
jgi:iron(III) transport system substrate-binding protein